MSVQKAYDRWAEQYDDNHNRTRDLNRRCLRQADLPLAGARVFEAGCGTGLETFGLRVRFRGDKRGL